MSVIFSLCFCFWYFIIFNPPSPDTHKDYRKIACDRGSQFCFSLYYWAFKKFKKTRFLKRHEEKNLPFYQYKTRKILSLISLKVAWHCISLDLEQEKNNIFLKILNNKKVGLKKKKERQI